MILRFQLPWWIREIYPQPSEQLYEITDISNNFINCKSLHWYKYVVITFGWRVLLQREKPKPGKNNKSRGLWFFCCLCFTVTMMGGNNNKIMITTSNNKELNWKNKNGSCLPSNTDNYVHGILVGLVNPFYFPEKIHFPICLLAK